MSDPTDSTPRSIVLRSSRSLCKVRSSLVSRGLQDLANLTAAPSLMPSAQTDDIHEAARNGDRISVRRILDNDPAMVDARNRYDQTPLHLAAEEGHAEVVKLLLSQGADVEARDYYLGCEALWAEFVEDTPELFGHFSLARELLSSFYYQNGCTPLHLAAEAGHTDVARLLLSHGADVNAEDIWYQMPLHLAATNGHMHMTELLIVQDADVNRRDEQGETPLDHAVSSAITETLRQHGGVSGKAVR